MVGWYLGSWKSVTKEVKQEKKREERLRTFLPANAGGTRLAASRAHRARRLTMQAVHKVVRDSKRGYWNDLPKRIDGGILNFPNDLDGNIAACAYIHTHIYLKPRDPTRKGL